MRTAVRRGVLAIVAVAALAAGGHYGWQWWIEGRFLEKTDNAYVESDISVIAPKVAGYVLRVAVEDNQPVKAGDLLMLIDQSDFKAKSDQIAAQVAAAEAAIGSNDTRLELAKSSIAQAEASARSAEADRSRTGADLKRYQELSDRQFASAQRYETALADSRKADAAVTRARAAVVSERDQVLVLQAQRKELDAQLAQARATLAMARIDLENTEIRAPVDGVVGNRAARVGQYVRAGTQVMAVVPLQSVYVIANFKETQIAQMQRGQAVSVSVDALPGRPLRGRIDSLAPASGSKFSLLPPENATGNFTKIVQRVPVKIMLDDGEALRVLRPGLSVIAAVDTRGAAAPSGALAAEPRK